MCVIRLERLGQGGWICKGLTSLKRVCMGLNRLDGLGQGGQDCTDWTDFRQVGLDCSSWER